MKKLIITMVSVLLIAVLAVSAYFVVNAIRHQSTRVKLKLPSDTSTRRSAPEGSAMPSPLKKVPPPPQSAEQDKVIGQIRSELQSVMDLNKKINAVQQTKSAQLLRIQEQAQIHQKILEEIQQTTPTDKKVKMPSREALLAQEKLRIIREETLRNKKLLEDASHKPAI